MLWKEAQYSCLNSFVGMWLDVADRSKISININCTNLRTENIVSYLPGISHTFLNSFRCFIYTLHFMNVLPYYFWKSLSEVVHEYVHFYHSHFYGLYCSQIDMFCSKTLSSLLKEFLLRRTESFLEKKDRKQNFGNLYFGKIFNTVAFKNENKCQMK